MNEYWSLWIKTSILKHLNDNIPYVKDFDGVPDSAGLQQAKDAAGCWCELRVSGPYFDSEDAGRFNVSFDVDVGISVSVGRHTSNQFHIMAGVVAKAFKDGIEIKRLGPSSDPMNDGTTVACFFRDKSIPIDVNYFGEIVTGQTEHGSVTTRYFGFLE